MTIIVTLVNQFHNLKQDVKFIASNKYNSIVAEALSNGQTDKVMSIISKANKAPKKHQECCCGWAIGCYTIKKGIDGITFYFLNDEVLNSCHY